MVIPRAVRLSPIATIPDGYSQMHRTMLNLLELTLSHLSYCQEFSRACRTLPLCQCILKARAHPQGGSYGG